MPTVLEVDCPGAGIRCYTVRPADGGTVLSITASVAAAAASILAFVASVRVGLATACLLIVSALLRRSFSVAQESLLIMEGIGLQLCTQYASGRDVTQFIEVALISEIIITEAVRVDRCFYYIACLSRGHEPHAEPRLIVPFRHLLPPLEQLQQIYLGARAVLWSEHEEVRPAPT